MQADSATHLGAQKLCVVRDVRRAREVGRTEHVNGVLGRIQFEIPVNDSTGYQELGAVLFMTLIPRSGDAYGIANSGAGGTCAT